MKIIQLIGILLLFILGYGNSYGQVIDKTYEIPGSPTGPHISGCNLVADGGFIVIGEQGYGTGFLLKVDSIGDFIWIKTFVGKHLIGDPEPTSDGGFIAQTIAVSTGLLGVNPIGDPLLAKFDSLGNIEYEIVDILQDYNNWTHGTSMYYERNNKINISSLYLEYDVNSMLALHNKIYQYNTLSGTVIDSLIDTVAVTFPAFANVDLFTAQTSSLSYHFEDSKVLLNNGKVVSIANIYTGGQVGSTPIFNMAFCIVDSFGQIETFKYQNYIPVVGDAEVLRIAQAVDGGFIVVGINAQGNFLLKLDSTGEPIWVRQNIPNVSAKWKNYYNISVLDNGNIICLESVFDYQGNYLRPVELRGYIHGFRADGETIYLAKSNGVDSIRIIIDHSLGRVYPDTIAGNIYRDLNLDCTKNVLEEGIGGIRVEAIGNFSFVAITDSFGNYSMPVDTGTYTVSVTPPSLYWTSCNPSTTVSTNSLHTTNIVNFGLQTIIDCPIMTVDIGAPFIRATGGGSVYTVFYCNNGTIDAINASVEVELDPNLNVLSTTIPIVSQVGSMYTFNIGDVGMSDCGSFRIQVIIDSTSAALWGQTYCAEAHIYPDSICIPNYWNGPIIEVDAECLVDTVAFLLENVGTPMAQPLQYFVYEDNVMFRTGNTTVLGNGGTEVILEPALPGKTYRIDVSQATGFPPLLGDTTATIAIEGCNPFGNGTFNVGFVTQLSNDNRGTFIAQDCQVGIAAYDPNDKATQPEGYGIDHSIYEDTKLDYRIRFQNTGNDTAFTVVVRDTISPFLNPATIEMGASSHNYTWNLSGQGVLEVRFSNILLVDSTTNEPASHGFFYYEIEQKANNPIGTVINNTAGIYFDYNPPIFTNTTYHTVGEDFIVVHLAIGKLYEEEIAVKVFPNPFTHFTTIQVEGKAYESLKLSVFDVTGRLVAEESSAFTNSIELQNNNFGAGIYIYHLEGDGGLINTGKLIVQ
jgi:hypothetical protein